MDALENSFFKESYEKDQFQQPTGKVVLDTQKKDDKSLIDNLSDKAVNLKNIVVNETKTLAPDVKKTFEKSSDRLNSEKRLISAVPNSFIYWTLIGIGVYVVAKNI